MQQKSLDHLVAVLSARSRFQTCLLILLGFNYVPIVFNHVIMVFFSVTPAHVCTVSSPSALGNSSSYQNVTVLEEKRKQCLAFMHLENGENISVKCHSGQWQYRPLQGEKTIVSEWDLVCDNKHLGSLATTIYFSGVMVGGLLFGFLSDSVGRRPILLFTLYVPIVIGVGTAFASSYMVFVLLRFVQGLLLQGLQSSSYILAMEFFVPAQRPMVGAVMECFWGATVLVLPGLAYALPNWRHLQIAISLPSILALFYICVVPESLRWLLLKGKIDGARQLVSRMSSFNGAAFPDAEWETACREVTLSNESSQQQYHFLHLFKTPRLRQRSVILFYIWLSITTGYYGLTFNIRSLPGNLYLNFFISGLVELVHYVLSYWIMNRFGRKKPLLVYFLSAGVCCIVAASLPHQAASHVSLSRVSTAFAIIGRFFIAGLFSVIFVYTTELFPTVIRNIGMGTCLFWARLGGVIAPQINQLGASSSLFLPILVFGCMMLLGGAVLFFLPETHGLKLPDVINDVENPHSANDTLGQTPFAEQLIVRNGVLKEPCENNAL